MGWMQRLCDVYDVVSRIDIPEETNHTQLVPVGFTKKKITYEVIVTADGRFSSAHKLGNDESESKIKGKNSGNKKNSAHKPGNDERECIVPTTPEAEGRTGAKGAPYPLAENLKYFAGEEGDPELLDRYLDQLTDWCAQPEAPECLKTLLAYLNKRTLLADLRNDLSKGLKLHKDESRKDFAGPDGKAIICFSVEDPLSTETRLWKRKDVQDSWSAYFARRQGGAEALCYATGEMLPVLDNHPKVQGNAKLISAKDAGYPFQYKGRFVEDRSAATVSAYASDRAHRALQYLMDHQGLSFRQFGLNIVAWEVQKAAAMYVPLHAAEDEDEDEDNIALPDTFEGYARTLRDAAKGVGKTDKVFEKCIANLVDGEERASSVVIMSMVAATDGRMSIDYYQELPDDLYVSRITDWYRSCCWTYWNNAKKRNVVRTPTPLSIANAVMGTESVRRAKDDRHYDKSDAKQLCALYKRLLKCIVEGAPLPRNFLKSAVHRAEAPLTFHDSDGNWRRDEWKTCIRTTCALIRRSRFDAQKQLPSAQLDRKNRNRDYLYGRLLALADQVECKAAERSKLPTNAIRLTQRFVQYPKETWLHLHAKLLPYLAALGSEGEADGFMHKIADVESLFERADRESTAALGEDFLLGYFAQRQDVYRSHEQDVPNQGKEDSPVYAFGTDRSERFGMLAAVADFVECRATLEERGERTVSTHDGNTAALRMMVRFTQQPAATWAEIHAKLLPYLEKLGIRSSAYPIARLRAIEEGFDCKERLDNTPLDSLFLHGFYRMRACMRSGGKAALEAQTAQDCPLTRNSAYASLLAIENRVERAVLDLEKREDENRTSNAVRFMNKFAVSPASTWRYLDARMKPYLKKLRSVRTGWALNFKTRIDDLNEAIRKNGWNNDQPLSADWLHAYYTADKIIKKQERST